MISKDICGLFFKVSSISLHLLVGIQWAKATIIFFIVKSFIFHNKIRSKSVKTFIFVILLGLHQRYGDITNLRIANSLEKWLHNRIYCPSNRSKQIQETHTAYNASTQYTRQSLNEKQHIASQTITVCLWSYTIYAAKFEWKTTYMGMLFFIQTLPRILCAVAISLVSFLDLFGPIAGAINPIM